jgi:threonine dehydrogenase-like Zn-dependent dehydrogenase
MGVIEQVGEGVTLLKKGDRVVMPFNVADGRCRNCEEGKTAFCTGVNPGFAGGAYGMQNATVFLQGGFESSYDRLIMN